MARVKQLEIELINSLTNELGHYRVKNKIREAYYSGKDYLQNQNRDLPEKYWDLFIPVSWPEIVVERKNERINMLGFTAPNDAVDNLVKKIVDDNYLLNESTMVHRDSFLFGNAYCVGSFGDTTKNEAEILLTVESPNNTVGRYNRRSRDLDCLLQVKFDDYGKPFEGVLHLRDKTIVFKYDTSSTVNLAFSEIISVDSQYAIYAATIETHNRGFVFAGMFPNRPRGSMTGGVSEISPIVMAHTDQAVRTFTEAALAREIFATPQRYLLGADMTPFMDKDGNLVAAWQAYMDKVWMTPPTKNGQQQPTVGQFDATSPAPLFEHVKASAEVISAASGVPMSQMGYTSQGNPASAEAILAQNEVLIKTAEDRMVSWGAVWSQLMKMAVRLKLGDDTEGVNEIRPQWRSAATTTLAGVVDSMSKLAAIGAIQPDSEVLLDVCDFTDSQKTIIQKENAAAKKEAADLAVAAASALAGQQNALKQNPPIQEKPKK